MSELAEQVKRLEENYNYWRQLAEQRAKCLVAVKAERDAMANRVDTWHAIARDKDEQCKKLREMETKYAALEKAAEEMAAELEKKSAAVERMGRRIQRLEDERAGWRQHSADKGMPVHDSDYVEVRRRNGSTTSGYAFSFTWGLQGEHTIVAYRIDERPKANKAPTSMFDILCS